MLPNDQSLSKDPIVRPLTAAVAAALGTTFAGSSLAQEIIEEIIVTATRREAGVQEIPFNIAAVSGDVLDRQRITTLAEVSRWVPGLTLIDQGPRAADLMNVRGLNVDSLTASEFLSNTSGQTVATYLGDIPLYVDLKMRDLERVEVLMGPQGTLYGAGTLGGAVRYIPRAPDPQEFSLDFYGDVYSLSESDGAGYEANFTVNAPLIQDRLALRANVGFIDDPGFIDYPFLLREPGISDPEPDFNDPDAVAANLWSVKDANTEETLYGRLALGWDFSDSASANVTYYFQDQEVGGRSINHRDAFGTDDYSSAHRFLEPNDRKNELLSLDLVADLGFAQLTTAAGFSEFNEEGERDQTDLLLAFEFGYEDFPSFAALARDTLEEETTTLELRLVSTGTGPWSWIGGVFYRDFELGSVSEEFTPGYPEFIGVDRPDNLEFILVSDWKRTERAVFGEIGYQLTDRWQVTVGGRWFEYDADQRSAVDFPLFNGTPDEVFLDFQDVIFDDDGFIGKLNTSYQFSDDVMGYMTISEGYRIGGANAVAPCEFPPPPVQNACASPSELLIKPDTTTNLEIGVHSRWLDGALTLNGSLYSIDWNEIQTASTTAIGALPITVNGGSAKSEGLELALLAQLNSDWSVSGAYAYNNAELTSDAPGLVDGIEDGIDGDRLPGTPKRQASFYVNYFRVLQNGWDLDVDYGFTATDDVYTKVGLRNNGEVMDGYTIHSISAGLSNGQWSATLYVDNLTDEFAETAVRSDQSFIGNVGDFALRRYFRNVLRPRTVGIEFRYRL